MTLAPKHFAKPVVFAACSLPAALLVYGLFMGTLGPNPVEVLVRDMGDWALRFVLLALAVTPLRKITGWNEVARYRRMIGLFAFFYGFMHMMAYVGVDHFFHWPTIWEDLIKRPYITIGFAAVLILTALAITSPKKMIKKMGGKAWQKLHRLVYLAAIGGVIHFFLLIKAGFMEPLIYALILTFLLGFRVWNHYRNARPARAPARPRGALTGKAGSQ